ncbi:DNRLRE domain-containing protein [Nocardioides marmorisolisilvae]|uniref:DNRLRE domain-containing protein n=1 Tax=Nocardioides marmorisolisilvae TaxID=1542737 RepID=A0A3N0DQ29_9ACTN|nr:DNRLRE domain-containing protein [Nocardioides marmorisolisilvae]RNL77591.1 DNRLRE domain-containing protein [Nocardioides marmorisolisilvae]
MGSFLAPMSSTAASNADGPTVAEDQDAAMAAAMARGSRVEDASRATASTATYANPDGTWTTELYSGVVRSKDDQGKWVAIDPSLEKEAGAFEPVATAFDASYSDGGDKTIGSVDTGDGSSVTVGWPTSLPAPEVDDDQLIYSDVASHTDLVVSSLVSGFNYSIVLDQAPAADAAPIVYRIPLTFAGGTAQVQDDGSIVFRDGSTTLATLTAPVMWDAANASVDGERHAVEASVEGAGMSRTLVLKPDMGFLQDPQTTYPVTVDPTVYPNVSADTWLDNVSPNTSQINSGELRIGSVNLGFNKDRSYLTFDLSSLAGLSGAAVSANLVVSNFDASTCSASAVRMSRVTSSYNVATMTWSTQPTTTATDSTTTNESHGASSPCAAEGPMTWDASAIVSYWLANPTQNYGVQLKADTESNATGYRKLRSMENGDPSKAPKLVVTYNFPPSTPAPSVVNPSVTSGTNQVTNAARPEFSAVLSDPDGSPVSGDFELRQGILGTVVDSWTSPIVPSGSTVTHQVPTNLTNGSTYKAYWRAKDASLTSPWSTVQNVLVDLAAPPSPGVTCPSYTNGTWYDTRPAASTTCTVTTSGDATAVSVTLNGNQVTMPPLSGGSTAKSFDIATDDVFELGVTAQDLAGNQATTSFTTGTGAGRLLSPTPGTFSKTSFAVAAGSKAAATSGALQWRPSGGSTWTNATQVTAGGTAWSGTVTSTGAIAKTPTLTWSAKDEPGIADPSDIETRTCFNYSGGTSRCTAGVVVTLTNNLAPSAPNGVTLSPCVGACSSFTTSSTTPEFLMQASDPEGADLTYRLQIRPTGGGGNLADLSVGPTPSSGQNAIRVGPGVLSPSTTYEFRTGAADSSSTTWSPWTGLSVTAAASGGTVISSDLTISTDTTWTKANSPYVLSRPVTVASGATLTLEPGVVVKVINPIDVYGLISAEGTLADPIVFTSYKDDSVGGDSNGDGTTSLPTPGDYGRAIGFWNPTLPSLGLDRESVKTRGDSVLKNVSFRYGAGDTSGSPCFAGNSLISLSSLSRVRIEHSEFSALAENAIMNPGPDPELNSLTVRFSRFGPNTSGCALSQVGAGTFYGNVFQDPNHGNVDSLSTSTTGYHLSFVDNWFFGPITLNIDGFGQPLYPRDKINFEGNAILHGWLGENNQFFDQPEDLSNNWWGHVLLSPPACWYGPGVNYPAYKNAGSNFTECVGINTYTDHKYALAVLPALEAPPAWLNPGLESNPAAMPNMSPDALLGSGNGEYAYTPTGTQADPVNSATGSYFEQHTDAVEPSVGLDVVATRSYNSLGTATGSFGVGWSFGYDEHLSFPSSALVRFSAGDGQVLEFGRSGNTFTPTAGVTADLERDGTDYLIKTKPGLTYRFEQYGRLTQISDRHTNAVALTYDATGHLASASNGARQLTFTYTGDRLTKVFQPGATGTADDKSVVYGYTNEQLSSVTDQNGATTRYTYNAQRRLASTTDPLGHVVMTLAYDVSSGRVTDQWDALNNHSTFAWNPTTQTAVMTDPRGNPWTDVYSGTTLLKRTDPEGRTWKYTRDANLQVTSFVDPNKAITTLDYDERGNVIGSSGPLGTISTEYNSLDLPTRTVDSRHIVTLMAYNSAGDLTKITRPTDPGAPLIEESFTYNANGTLNTATDALGHTTGYTYTASGDLATVTTPGGKTTTYSYLGGASGHGLLGSTTTPRTKTTNYTYDQVGRLLTAVDPLNRTTTSNAYNSAGWLTSSTDAKSRTTVLDYDAAGHIVKVTSPDTSALPVLYEYDANGNQNKVTDPAGRITTTAYNGDNEVSSTTSPTGSTSYTRTKLGQIQTVTTPDALTTTLSYDTAGRLDYVDYPGSSTADVSYRYDSTGNRSSMTDGSGTVTYAYDRLNQVASVQRAGTAATSYTYLGDGSLSEVTYPTGTKARYTYDLDRNISTVATKPSGGSTYTTQGTYTWTDDGLPATAVTGVGLGASTRTYTYDDADRVTRLQDVMSSGAVLLDDSYFLDNTDNPTRITHNGGSSDSYTYDVLDRLTKTCFGTTTCTGSTDYVGWTYDALGNRLSEARPSGTYTYTYNSTTGRLTTVTPPSGPSVGYTYDGRGQVTQVGSNTYTYNLAGRVVTDSDGTTYAYDGDGRRLTSTKSGSTLNYLWDPQSYNLLDETTSSGTQREYTYGLGLVSITSGAGALSSVHADSQGSVRALTDSGGTTTYAASYEPYGLSRSSTGTSGSPLGFSGQYSDTTGLQHLRARQYDPASGRFLAPDMVATASANAYSYADDNPMVEGDPSGLFGEGYGSGLQYYGQKVLPVAGTLLSFTPGPIGAIATAGIALYEAYTVCVSGKGSCGTAVLTAAGLAALGATGIGAYARLGRAAKSETELVQRWMSQAELDATRSTGLVRGGRDGTHYVTDFANHDPLRARQRLALPQTPEVRVQLEVPRGFFSSPKTVHSDFNMPGGGLERTATGPVQCRVVCVWD